MTSAVRGGGATLAVRLVVCLQSSSRWARPASAMATPPSPGKAFFLWLRGSIPAWPSSRLTDCSSQPLPWLLLSPRPLVGVPRCAQMWIGVPQVCPGVARCGQVYPSVPDVPRCAPAPQVCPGVPHVCSRCAQVHPGMSRCAPGVPRCALSVIPSN